MSEPSHQLQKETYDRLRNSAAVQAQLGNPARVYDSAPPSALFPYAVIGEAEVNDDSNSCNAAWEVYSIIHVWSREQGGMNKLKLASGAVRDALAAELSLVGFAIIFGEHENTQYLRDPDGITTHAVVRFRYLIDPA